MKSCQLTGRKVSTAKTPGYYGDGGGLYLQVSKTGTKSWVYRFMLNGRAREMGLGSLNTFTLKEARVLARDHRQLVAKGIDPIEERRKKRDEALSESAKRITFEEAAERYIAAHATSWKNPKHRAQWAATLETYAYPIKPIWTTKTETASRLRGRIERILAWATVRKYRKGENPARWKGHLGEMLPSKQRLRKTKHHEALPVDEVPAFMSELRERTGLSPRALEFTILTAARTSETIQARWEEIDFDAGTWTVPAERMKSGKEHVVPLSQRACDILTALPREGDGYVFPGMKLGGHISNMAMLELLRGMRGNGLTVHGFRSSFRDWAGDKTNFAREVIETAMSHQIKDRSEAAYRRTAAVEKRRKLMEAWAGCCAQPTSEGRVIAIGAVR